MQRNDNRYDPKRTIINPYEYYKYNEKDIVKLIIVTTVKVEKVEFVILV